MRIVCISDIHSKQEHMKHFMPMGDIVVCTGDITMTGSVKETEPFLKWYGEQNYKHKILIAGNHDWGFETRPKRFEQMCKDNGITYLNDSGTEIDGIKFWGSPVQPAFCSWAFNRARNEKTQLDYLDMDDFGKPLIKPHWDKIPEDTDVLLTHGPPAGIRDLAFDKRHVGCQLLLERIYEVKPKLCVFGHVHFSYGKEKHNGIEFVNASTCDPHYMPINQPIVVDI